MELKCCHWANKDFLSKQYHDFEWGIPVHNDQKIFEFIVLESMQAGLSWSIVLQKRTALKNAFDNFDYYKIANYDQQKFNVLLNNEKIIRHRLKIKSVVENAKNFIKIQNKFGSFDHYIWQFVNYQPIINHWNSDQEIPITTELSDLIAKDLKKHGFKFLGSITIYSFLQAIGVIDDHLQKCFKKNKN